MLHTALRLPRDATLEVDGQDVVADVHEVLDRVYAFADEVRSGDWTGVTGERIRTVVNIGIGGSDLGPVMAYEALAAYRQDGLECRFISNIDPTDAATDAAGPRPRQHAVHRLQQDLRHPRDADQRPAVQGLAARRPAAEVTTPTPPCAKHFVAVSTALDKVADFGIDPDNAFGFWDWVGGRYSMDSAIGTSLVVAIGPERFAELLAGFHTMDEHFRTTEPARNVPLLMGLLNVWYSTFLGAQTHAVLPYAQLLHRFPAYLQQLTMESNGKGVRWDGSDVTTDTGEIFWGEPGTNGQHAFYQLIHQGTRLVPADFIAFANPSYPLADGETRTCTSCSWPTSSPRPGRWPSARPPRRSAPRAPRRPSCRPGSSPATGPPTSIMAPALTPSVLGQLVALYEHVTFIAGRRLGHRQLRPVGRRAGQEARPGGRPRDRRRRDALADQDASTQALIAYYREHRASPERPLDHAEQPASRSTHDAATRSPPPSPAAADRRLTDAQADGGTPHVALTGGTIAGTVHHDLARLAPDSHVDWSRVVLWWGDERFVDADSDERNATQAREDFLDARRGPRPDHVHECRPRPTTPPTWQAAAAAYADDLRAHGAGRVRRGDAGHGPDGHVASLFPGYPQLDVDRRVAVAVTDSPKPPPERVSLTFPALNRSRVVWFLVSGDGKADAVAAALAADGYRQRHPRPRCRSAERHRLVPRRGRRLPASSQVGEMGAESAEPARAESPQTGEGKAVDHEMRGPVTTGKGTGHGPRRLDRLGQARLELPLWTPTNPSPRRWLGRRLEQGHEAASTHSQPASYVVPFAGSTSARPAPTGRAWGLRSLAHLVVPADCVVVDRHAGWIAGAEMVLAPRGGHIALRPLIVCSGLLARAARATASRLRGTEPAGRSTYGRQRHPGHDAAPHRAATWAGCGGRTSAIRRPRRDAATRCLLARRAPSRRDRAASAGMRWVHDAARDRTAGRRPFAVTRRVSCSA